MNKTIRAFQRERAWERIERLRARMAEQNAGRSDEEISADIEEARREITRQVENL